MNLPTSDTREGDGIQPPIVRDIQIYPYANERGILDALELVDIARSDAYIGVFALSSGWVHSPTWMAVTHDRHVFFDFSRILLPHKYDLLFTPEFSRSLDSIGTEFEDVFVLGGNPIYWHWLIDYLPRLYLLKVLAPLRSLRLMVDGTLPPAQLDIARWFLARLGIDPMPEFITVDPGVYRIRNAQIPSQVQPSSAVAIWENELGLQQSERSGPERLFIMRTNVNRRRLVNQNEIASILKPLGFVCVDPGSLSFAEQMSLFSNARMVVGVHGSALTNLLFSPRGGCLIELYTSFRQSFFRDLVAAKGFNYVVVEGDSLTGRTSPNDDFHIAPQRLMATLRPLL